MQPYSIRRRAFEESMNSAPAATTLLGSGLEVLLEDTLVLPLLRRRLVRTVTELRRRVDPLELHLFQRPPAGVNEHGLAQSNNALLDTGAVTLEQEKVILDLTVADEATHTDAR